jgi:hypothetical protein
MKERHYIRFTSFLEEFTTVLAERLRRKALSATIAAVGKSKPITGVAVIAKPTSPKT